jgi:4-hydroxybenzoate polyprenyltransferase
MLFALFKMIRPVNIVIAVVTLSIGYYLLGFMPFGNGAWVEIKPCDVVPEPYYGTISWASLILQSLGFAFAIAFANIQNDIWDLESDRLNRPERPLVQGKVTVKVAKCCWIVLLILTLACGVADSIYTGTNWTASIFFVLLSLLLVVYNKFLKHIPLLKNMSVGLLCATPLILCLFYPTGISETEDFSLEIIDKIGFLYPAMLFAFLLTTAREIYKDLEDETGDLKAGIMTFPLIAGAPVARRLAGFICLFCWAILPLPVVQGFYPTLFLIVAGAALTPITALILVLAHRKNYRAAQKLVKVAMFAGLVALLVSC